LGSDVDPKIIIEKIVDKYGKKNLKKDSSGKMVKKSNLLEYLFIVIFLSALVILMNR
jgi:hypothetical protein